MISKFIGVKTLLIGHFPDYNIQSLIDNNEKKIEVKYYLMDL